LQFNEGEVSMYLNDLLKSKDIDPKRVLVLRHRPWESQFNKVLPWLAAEKPDLFNAYQQTQQERVEGAMQRASHVAAFIARGPGKALFVGLYSVEGSKPISRKEFSAIPANVELKALGMNGWAKEDRRRFCLWFDLVPVDFYAHWKGKMIVNWPGKEISWWRWACNNAIPIHAILDESALDGAMPEWDAIDLSWDELDVLPARLKAKLREWRGVYYIFDASIGKGYVGSAYGENNLLGRWQDYATRGHGGNRLLRKRDPRNFRFTILQLDAPNRDASEVIRLEASWKKRLHTRWPNGLNAN
jgi:hypothetical protein